MVDFIVDLMVKFDIIDVFIVFDIVFMVDNVLKF